MIQSTDLQFLGRAGVNYLLSPGAETGRQGWSLFTTTFTSNVPTTISAGAANCTLTSSTTTPLRGTRSLAFAVTTAAGSAGQGFISDVFTIDNADLAKVLTAAFDYNFSAGGTSVDVSGATTQTLEIWVYNVGLAAWTQPAGFRGINQNSLPGYVAATFQTDSSNASNKNQYRIAVIIKNAPTGTFTMQVDQVVVGPQTVQYGAPVTDWQNFTPTYNGITSTGTGGSANGRWRRVGDSMELFVSLEFGTGPSFTGGALLFELPAGYAIDTTKVPSAGSITNAAFAGSGYVINDAGTVRYVVTPFIIGTRIGLNSSANASSAVTSTSPFAFGVGDGITFAVKVPILGWSSTVQMSNDTDTRVVAARISVPSGAQTLTNNVSTKIIGLSAEFDTHGAFNSSLQRYEIKVPGVYKVTWQVGILSAATDRLSAQIYKTGSLFTTTYIAGSSQGAAAPVSSTLISCTTSDYLEFYAAMEGTPTRNTNPGSNSIFASIERLSGPSAIAATETVAFSGQRTAGNYALNNSSQTITWSAVIDTHGGYSGTTYTVPISGLYEAYVYIQFENADAGTYCGVNLIAGSTSKRAFFAPDGGNVNYRAVQVSNIVRLVAGQTISVVGLTSGVADIRASLADENCFTVKRIGN